MKIIRVLTYTGDAGWLRRTLTRGIIGRYFAPRGEIDEYFIDSDSPGGAALLRELRAMSVVTKNEIIYRRES